MQPKKQLISSTLNNSSSLFKKIDLFRTKNNLIADGDKVVLALSGGPDSVFLFHYLLQLHKAKFITLLVAHVDHQWRETSKDDARFCRQLAEQNDIVYFETTLSEIDFNFKYNGSKEEYARKARRAFFEKVAQEQGAQSIALAHHAQDQQETFFIRLLRGTSLAGITGMKPKDGPYIRPLLTTHKKDLVECLQNNALPYCIDESNDSQDYLRNRIRHSVLPALAACDSRFDSNFEKTLERLSETEKFMQEHTADIFQELAKNEDGTYFINAEKFLQQPELMQQRIIVHWLCAQKVQFPVTQAFIDEMIRFITTPKGGTHHIAPSWALTKIKKRVYITTA